MKKHDRISAFVETLEASETTAFHPCYAGYFECFNQGDYYEAHDVLEHLWLECRDENHLYFKGLIQIAGAFVHLKKQSRKLTDNLASLQNELRLAQLEKSPAFNPPQPPPEPLPPTEAADPEIRTH